MTLTVAKRMDYHGCRTKRVRLEIYETLTAAIRTGRPYRTRLDPSPGPPCDAQGNFIPMAQWDPNNWPSHIHPAPSESDSTTESHTWRGGIGACRHLG